MKTDVVIVGGGPGGAVSAAQLVRHGLSVTVLERAEFPRFHLGESLLPQSMPVLEEIGVLSRVAAEFIPKYGARFHDDIGGKKERFSFDGAWKPIEHAFEVPRDTFDAILLDHARSTGATVLGGWQAERLTFDAAGRANGVEVTSPDGSRSQIEARFVVDATGRDALTARANASSVKIEGLDQTALFAHFRDVPRQGGRLEGDIDIVLFASGQPKRPNWFWFIPFKDGRTSVGAVVSRAWMRERSAGLPAGTDTTTALFAAATAASPTATELLAGATCLWPKQQATADFSYRVRKITGPGWLAVGDAAGFIDPLFSTGAHMAMVGGKLAADAIASALATPADEPRIIEDWETYLRAAGETFILAVQSFYAGPLVGLLFAEDKHSVLRRSITSLLAGDVFGDARWLRDTKARLKEMLAAEASG